MSGKLAFNNAIIKCNLSIVNSIYVDGLWFLQALSFFEIIPCVEPHKVQQGQVQGPTPESGQVSMSTQAGEGRN